MTITEDYVSFECAKLLKEKGFDELCECAYSENGQYLLSCYKGVVNRRIKNSEALNFSYSVVAPTLQMAMKWLREKHLLHISIDMVNGGRWEYEIDDISCPFDGGVLPKCYCYKSFCSYEEGINEAIKYCLENLI